MLWSFSYAVHLAESGCDYLLPAVLRYMLEPYAFQVYQKVASNLRDNLQDQHYWPCLLPLPSTRAIVMQMQMQMHGGSDTTSSMTPRDGSI